MTLSRCFRTATLVIGLAAAGAPLAAQGNADAQTQADVKEMQEYRLTVAMLAKMGQVQDNMYATLKSHPELARKYANQREEDGQPKTLDDMAKTFDRVPEVKQAIVKAGLTPRQYMLATMAMFQAAMAGAILEMPGADKSKIGPAVQANIAFLKAHKAEMDRMQERNREIEKLTRQATGEEEESSEEPADTTSGGAR